MLVESGLALALDEDKLTSTGGVHSPASAMGEILLERLKTNGTEVVFD